MDNEVFICPKCGREYDDDIAEIKETIARHGFCCDLCKIDNEFPE